MKAKIWIIILAISILFSKNIYAENNKQCCQIATNISKIIFNYLNKDQNLNKINIISEYKDKKVNFQNFMFHYIEDVPKNTKDKLRYNLSFSPQKFEELLKYLDENKIETITFEDLKEIFEWKKKMPEKAVILGFDDWHLDHYTEAFPLLKKYNKKWVFFIISSFPWNDQNYMNWEQIIEMSQNWQEIWSHTVSHPNLTTLNEQELKKELFESKKQIEEKIKKSVISIAYPIGKFNNNVLKYTKEIYIFARTTKYWWFIDTKNLLTIPTIRVTPEFSIKSISNNFENKK